MKNKLPLPKSKIKEERRPFQFECSKTLYEAVEREIKDRRLEKRQAGEHALRLFLQELNPKEAAKLGILPQDE